MKLGQLVLKLLSPKAEEARMSMREARCHAEASAEDLSRTMSIHSRDIQRLIKKGGKHVNGKNGSSKK